MANPSGLNNSASFVEAIEFVVDEHNIRFPTEKLKGYNGKFPCPNQKEKSNFDSILFLELMIDGIIAKLLAASYNSSNQADLLPSEIELLCVKSSEVFLSQPMLLEIEAPVNVCGECQFYTNWVFDKHIS